MLEDGSLRTVNPQFEASATPMGNVKTSMQRLPGDNSDLDEAMERARHGVVLPHEQLRKLGLARSVFGDDAGQAATSKPITGSILYVRDSDSDQDSDEDPDDDLDM